MDNVVDIRPRTIKVGNMEDGTIEEITLKPGETAEDVMDRLQPPTFGARRNACMLVEKFPDEFAYPLNGGLYDPTIRRGLANWMNHIHGGDVPISSAVRRILRPSISVMHEMVNDGFEVCDVAFKHPKKKKVVDQAKEGRLRKKELAAKFMTRQRIKREEKLTPEDTAEHTKKMFDSLDRRQHILMVSTPSGNETSARMLQHLHDMDRTTVVLGLPLPWTVFETGMNLEEAITSPNVIDFQAEMRKLPLRNDPYVLPQDVHSVKYFPFNLKEKDNEQGTNPPNCDS